MIADDLFTEARDRALSDLEPTGALERLKDPDDARKVLDAIARDGMPGIELAAAAELRRLEEVTADLASALDEAAARLAASGEETAQEVLKLQTLLRQGEALVPALEAEVAASQAKRDQLDTAEEARSDEAVSDARSSRAFRRRVKGAPERAETAHSRAERALAASREALDETEQRMKDVQRALMVELLSTKVPDPDISAAQARVDATREDTVRALAERGILPLWSEALNVMLEEQYGWRYLTSLSGASATGLSALPDAGGEVAMQATARLKRILTQLPGGSIGISGPRGAGKTTLIRAFCHADEPPRNAPRLAVMVNAPVKYAPLDFALHLFETACRATLFPGDTGEPPDQSTDIERDREVRVIKVAAWVAVCLGLIAAAAGLLLGFKYVRDAGVVDSTRQLLTAGLLVAAAAIVGAQAIQARDEYQPLPALSAFESGSSRFRLVAVAAATLTASAAAAHLATTLDDWNALTWLTVASAGAAGPIVLVLIPWVFMARPDLLWRTSVLALVAAAGTLGAAAAAGDPLGSPASLGAWLVLGAAMVTPVLSLGIRGSIRVRARNLIGAQQLPDVTTSWLLGSLARAIVAAGTIVGLVGLALIGLAALDDPPSATLGAAFVLVAAGGALAAVVSGARVESVSLPGVKLTTSEGDDDAGWAAKLEPERLARLEELAKQNLMRIRYQRGFAAGWSTKVGVSGAALNVPLTAEASSSGGRTTTEQPMTHPEAIACLRDFLSTAATTAEGMIIGIDELDKMSSDDEAEQFVNDIKAVFGIRGCYFLISVSEDAVASFERRGMPFRDVFDSAFDDVLRVSHLDSEGTDGLLSARTLEMPVPFKAICHALAGGLPRDVIRTARHLFDVRDDRDHEDLGAICRQLTIDELKSKRDGTVTAAARLGAKGDATALLQWLGAALPEPDVAALQKALAARPHIDAEGDDEGAGVRRALDRLAREFAAYWYLCVTLVEFFTDTREAIEFQRGESPGPQSFEQLAQARQAFTIDPGLAWDRVSAFRAEWDLLVLAMAPPPTEHASRAGM